MLSLSGRLRRAGQNASDRLLLRNAERTAAAYTKDQANRIQLLAGAAARRLQAGRELRNADNVAAAGALYREAATLAAQAVVAAKDPSDECLDLTTTELWEQVRADSELDLEQRHKKSALDETEELASADNALAIDRLPPAKAQERIDRTDAVVASILKGVEPRSVRRIRVMRFVRLLGILSVAVGALVWAIITALAPKNIAEGQPALAHSYYRGSAPASALVNGKRESPWGSATSKSANPWFQVDLGRSYRIDRVVVVHRKDRHVITSVPLTVELSLDGRTYDPVARFDQKPEPGEESVYQGTGKSARFVRVMRMGGPAALALSEIEVYGQAQ